MDWRRSRQSDNVEQTGTASRPGRGGGRLSLGGVAILVAVGLAMGRSPTEILGVLVSMNGNGGATTTAPTRPNTAEQNEQVQFVRSILGSTEDTWAEVFASAGQQYPAPKMIVFQGAVQSACGHASSAMGPFYCPGDQQVYLDLDFFREMEQQIHASGDLARAYVIAHEVGHHVQNVLGSMGKVDQARRRGATMEGAEGLSVRQELQADCYAGIWAKRAEQRLRWLEPGDIESALAAASAIGDDALQRATRGQVMPDSFTHGSSAQRVRWFKTGLASGELSDCDTSAPAAL